MLVKLVAVIVVIVTITIHLCNKNMKIYKFYVNFITITKLFPA